MNDYECINLRQFLGEDIFKYVVQKIVEYLDAERLKTLNDRANNEKI